MAKRRMIGAALRYTVLLVEAALGVVSHILLRHRSWLCCPTLRVRLIVLRFFFHCIVGHNSWAVAIHATSCENELRVHGMFSIPLLLWTRCHLIVNVAARHIRNAGSVGLVAVARLTMSL